MKRHSRLFLSLALTAVLALVVWQRMAVNRASAAAYTGTAQIGGKVQLDLTVSPPVASPRDILQLELRLLNRESTAVDPLVTVQLPASLHTAETRLPPGASLNVQANTLTWQPHLAGRSLGTLSLPLRVEAVDLANPEAALVATLSVNGDARRGEAIVWLGTLPQITAVLDASQVSIGQPVQLTAAVQGPGPLKQVWHLGDGRRVDIGDPLVVYPTAGVYEVAVEVSNPLGTVRRTAELTIVPHAAAQFAPDDDTPGAGQTVTFRNESGGAAGMSYTWDFGDGTLSTETHPLHTYQAPGTYQVRLLASNVYGTSETMHTVTVGVPPAADILVAESAPAGDILQGMANADESVTQMTWEMGDGRVYEGSQVAHAYRQTGDYYVTLTAKNEFGETRVGKWVHVEPGTLRVFLPLVGNMIGLTGGSTVDAADGALGLNLEPVALDGEFRMPTLDLPAEISATEALFRYLNEARRLFDLPAFANDSALNAAAQAHAVDMASYDFTNHTGSDSSTPEERFLFYGYGRGYAGEAAAWGFEDPKAVVEWWVNSEAHRPIVLNRYATDVGVGYGRDYAASSIWYWTAEFGNRHGSGVQPTLRVEGPPAGSATLNSAVVTFLWNYSQPLMTGQRFTVYLTNDETSLAVGSVDRPVQGTRYALSISPLDFPSAVGQFEWQVQLEGSGVAQLAGPQLAITINRDPSLPTPTPLATVTPAATAVAPTATLPPTATPVAEPPTPTPRPTTAPPVIITATPAPTAQP